jgi:SOS-response transcriptional repressor LexA
MDLADIIKARREAIGLSQVELAEKLGVSRQAISDWENRRGFPRARRFKDLERILGLERGSIDTFSLPGVIKLQQNPYSVDNASKFIPVINLSDITSEGPMRHESRTAIPVESEYPEDCYGVLIEDQSMAPDYVPGDIAIVSPSIPPRDGDDVVATYNDSPVLRRYRPRGNAYDLVPLSSDYLTVTINDDQPGMVLATLIEHRRRKWPRRP